MPQLYILIACLIAINLIVFRRHFLFERDRKIEFKKKIASKVDALKKAEQKSPSKRFKDTHNETRKGKKVDFHQYKELMRKADIAIAKEQWKKAKPLLIQALGLHHDELPASLKLAEVYMASEEWRRAQVLYQHLLTLDPDHPVIYAKLAKIHTLKKRYKEAIKAYVKAIELNEKNDEWLMNLGKLYQLLMHHSVAAECFRRAAELKPREVDYLFLLAQSCSQDDDFDNALFTYEKILTLEPYNERAQNAAQEVRVKMKEAEIMIKTIAH